MKKTWLVLLVVILVTYGVIIQWQRQHYVSLVPKKIKTERVSFIEVQEGIGPGGGCGVAGFVLASETLKEISEKSLDFFSDVVLPRNVSIENNKHVSKWRQTPYVFVNTNNGLANADRWFVGFSCGSLKAEFQKKIESELSIPGSYYTSDSRIGIIVLPRLRLVVVSFWD